MNQATTISSVTTEDRVINGPHGAIPLRVYRPTGHPSSALLWMHGGGFRHGSIDMPEAHGVSAELAVRASALVVSVDYRLAGDGVRFPVPLDDVYAAWKWLTSTATSAEIGVCALGGASAGAALALAAALRGRDDSRPADRLLLAYPFTHYPNPAIDDETAREMAALPGLLRFPPETVESMVGNYVGRITDIPVLALPGAARLNDLPFTAIALSQFDDLRPSGELLQRQMASVGVQVRTHLAVNMPHGHLNHVPVPAEATASLEFLASALSAE
ncbi:alpha/beta hydrolase [Streptomyces sp. NBC_00656]|uniref:alpha/beta hydrolase fold domain-containing protein n=1 Tax=Streptomyces sp. NBC_00656 TaxID=2903668 RepID=UPI003248769A